MENKLLHHIQEQIEDVIRKDTPEGLALWKELLRVHPADIAHFVSNLEREQFQALFNALPRSLKRDVFIDLPGSLKVYALSFLRDQDRSLLLTNMNIDELTDLFDLFSNEELKKYLSLLSTQDRQKVLSLMQFDPESAGGIMDTDVLTLMKDFTVEKSIHVLQRLQPRLELHQQIYVVNEHNQLMGHINLEDLVLKSPSLRLQSFMHKNELVINVTEDREEIAKKMIHYRLMTVPVIGNNDYFLGVIPSDTLVAIIEREARENVYRMSAMAPSKRSYFEASFIRVLYERSSILIVLLAAQSLSTMILRHYEVILSGFFMFFTTMLISAGGNSSSQTSAVVIQGLASGELDTGTLRRFLRREFCMAFLMAIILGTFAFLRVYLTFGNALNSFAVSLALAVIVLVSVLLGSGIPLILQRLNIDPAFAAGPFLATIMDIMGLLIYCMICKLIIF